MKKPTSRTDKPKGKGKEVVLLKDLAPRADVKGGGGKMLFGEHVDLGDDLNSQISLGDESQR